MLAEIYESARTIPHLDRMLAEDRHIGNRNASRHAVSIRACLLTAGRVYRGAILNISSGGAYFVSDKAVCQKTGVLIWDSYRLWVNIVRTECEQTGLEFQVAISSEAMANILNRFEDKAANSALAEQIRLGTFLDEVSEKLFERARRLGQIG